MATISSILVLFSLLFAQISCQWGSRQYVLEKDFFSGVKSGEFSVYDQSGRNLLFRLESRYAFTQTAELYVYPQKQIVASLRNTISLWGYEAEIQVFDLRYNQWIQGRISQTSPAYRFRYTIVYGNRRLTMEKSPFSLTTEIRDEQQANYVLARIGTRFTSIIWSNKYDLQVYTDELPDVIYILAVAAYDRNNGQQMRQNQIG